MTTFVMINKCAHITKNAAKDQRQCSWAMPPGSRSDERLFATISWSAGVHRTPSINRKPSIATCGPFFTLHHNSSERIQRTPLQRFISFAAATLTNLKPCEPTAKNIGLFQVNMSTRFLLILDSVFGRTRLMRRTFMIAVGR